MGGVEREPRARDAHSQVNQRKAGIPPEVPADAALLILGSLPGEASLAVRRYYAHPRNLFWRLVGGAIGQDLSALDYPDRLAALAAARIGLWDVVASARRPGSLDSAMRAIEANPLADLVRTLPDLRAVAFNGATSARVGRKALADLPGIRLIDLPSSSPAHAAMSYADKAARWAVLADVLAGKGPHA